MKEKVFSEFLKIAVHFLFYMAASESFFTKLVYFKVNFFFVP